MPDSSDSRDIFNNIQSSFIYISVRACVKLTAGDVRVRRTRFWFASFCRVQMFSAASER